MIKYLLAWRFVKIIFEEAKAYDWNGGKALFSVNETILKTYFPKEYARTKERVEKNNARSLEKKSQL